MGEPDDLYDHTVDLHKRRVKVADPVPTGEFGSKERPEVVELKKTDELVDPASIKDGEVTR